MIQLAKDFGGLHLATIVDDDDGYLASQHLLHKKHETLHVVVVGNNDAGIEGCHTFIAILPEE
jgi:hypothetical protein